MHAGWFLSYEPRRHPGEAGEGALRSFILEWLAEKSGAVQTVQAQAMRHIVIWV